EANIIQSQEAALEDVAAFGVFAVNPPGEVEHELVEDALEECAIARTPALLLDLIDAPGRPGVHWWVHIGQGPLVRGQLSIGVHVPLTQEQGELLLGEIGVYQG